MLINCCKKIDKFSLSKWATISSNNDVETGKLIAPRKLHNTQWGIVCPAETPEGGSVGVVKNLSYLAHITIYSHSDALYEYVNKLNQIQENKEKEILE